MKKLLLIISIVGLSGFAFAQPANDDCTGAATAPQDGSCVNGTTVNATPSMAGDMNSVAGCGPTGTQGDDVWYSFTATNTYWDFTLTTGSSGPIGVVLFDDGCSLGTFGALSINCVNGTSLTGSYNGLTVGNTYYILVITRNTKDRAFTLCTETSAPVVTTPNVDCNTATPLCGSTTQNGNSDGFGTQNLNGTNQGCLSIEHESSWYTFTASTSGTFQMTISPTNGTDDYDFALWSNSNCGSLGNPTRCSYAAGGGNTGIGNGASDNSEGALGNKWVADANITAGTTYTLLIDNFSSTTSPFNLTFGGTATWDCSVLSMSLKKFDASAQYGYNLVSWTTSTERNNDYFIIEGSTDGYVFQQLGTVKGSGTTTSDRSYSFKAMSPEHTINYYRLTTVDENGGRVHYQSVSVDNKTAVVLLKTYNMLGQEVEAGTKGLVFEYYSDGSTKKIYR